MRRALAWTMLFALLLSPLALADDEDDDDDKKSESRSKDERKLELDVDDMKASIKLGRETDGLEDAVKIEYDARKAKLVVKHEEKNASVESEAKLEARFLTLLEFVDADADGAYDVGEQIASAWSLAGSDRDVKIPTVGDVAWGDISVSDVTSGNVSGKKLSSRASFAGNATFGLDLYVYGDFTLVGEHSLAPTEAKIDILIERYPYARNDSALAVLVDLKAKEEFEDEAEDDGDDGEEGVFSDAAEGNLTFRLTFTWLSNATVDGVDRDVRATVLKEKQSAEDDEIQHKARVAIAYPRGESILHDPTVGVAYATASGAVQAVPLPAVPLLLAAVAVGVVLAGRRR